MKPPQLGYQHVSLTKSPKVARYFAEVSREDCETGELSDPIVLRVSKSDLLARGLSPAPFLDPIWGEGECAWEQEMCISRAVPSDLFEPITTPDLPDGTSLSSLREAATSDPECPSF